MTHAPAAGPGPPFGAAARGLGLRKMIGGHWKIYLAEGVIFIILGVLALFAPFFASVAVAIFIGWLFLLAGVASLFMSWRERQAPGFWWGVLCGAMAILAGLLLLIHPLPGCSR